MMGNHHRRRKGAAGVLRLALLAAAGWSAGSSWAQAPGTMAPFAAGRATVTVEALFMWLKSSPTPVPIITDEYYGLPDTKVLLGGGSLDTNPKAGFRISGAYPLQGAWGIEAIGFHVPSRSTSRSVSSDGSIASIDLLLPFFDVTLQEENITEISFSPIYAGTAQETLENSLGGGEINATWSMPARDGWKIDLIGGFRYLDLREKYTITTSSPNVPPYPVDIWQTTDQFDATNRFYGLQIGARAVYDKGPWVGSGFAKLALGTMQQSVAVSGKLETNDFSNYGAVQTFSGGYFALPSNAGNHSRSQFAVVPEIGLSLGYRVAPAATFFVAYTFLYANDVVRPGEQVDRNINPTQSVAYTGETPAQLVGQSKPGFDFNTSDFWAQSISVGFSYRF